MALAVVKAKGWLTTQPLDHALREVVARGEIGVVNVSSQVQPVVKRNVEDGRLRRVLG